MRKNIEISEDKIKEFLEQFYGYFENGYAFAGSNAWRTTRIMSVKETFNELISEWKMPNKKREQ